MMNEQGTGFKYAEIMKDVGVEKKMDVFPR